ncbi:alpha/beta hydrolase [Bradyrhizobium sp. NAS80.1]|uniref:alpha/beta fold hydrolase n=1 Tax=Bradyrhizobium sp. NAS80.1 TaxID=1680159 RepID=UPI000A05F7D7|nr:alpha/beta hydrolase [Bradyrhizobium sp. NAS80.1]
MRTYQIWHGIAATTDGRSLAHVARGIGGFDVRDRLATLPMPALFIAGYLDRMSVPEESQRMASAAPRGHYACIGGAAHISNVDSAEAFTDRLMAFLVPEA